MDLLKYLYIALTTATVLELTECGRYPRAPPKCPRLQGFNGKVKYRKRGTRAVFRCGGGQTRYGNRFITCRKDGTWDGPMPVCIKSGCVPVDISGSPYLDMSEEYRGALLKFTCEGAYRLQGASESYCDGQNWSAPPPKCVATEDLLECDFEKDSCYWSQDDTDKREWIRNAGATATGNTGPKFDHTYMDQATGHYMFFEASSPTEFGDQARLISPEYSADMSPMCFDFWYHMLGPDQQGHVCSLSVYVRGSSQFLDDLQPLFYKDSNQGDVWNRGEIAIVEMTEPYQIVIEATRKLGYASDIAIDDLRLYNCTSDTTTSTTVKPTTTVELTTTTTSPSTPTPAPTTPTTTTKRTTVAPTTVASETKAPSTKSSTNSIPTTVVGSKLTSARTKKASSSIQTKPPVSQTQTTPTSISSITAAPSTTISKRSEKAPTTVSTTPTTVATTRPDTSTSPVPTTAKKQTTETTVESTTIGTTTTTVKSGTTPTTMKEATVSSTSQTTEAPKASTTPIPKSSTKADTKATKTVPTSAMVTQKPTKNKRTTRKPTKATTTTTTTTKTAPANTEKATTLEISASTTAATKATATLTTKIPTTVKQYKTSPKSTELSRTTSQTSTAISAPVKPTSSEKAQTQTTTILTTAVQKQTFNKSAASIAISQQKTTSPSVSVKTSKHPEDDTLKPLMIGLGVGIVAGLIVIGVIAYVCVRRRKFYTSRYEDELKPITNAGSSQSINNVQYYHDEEYEN